MKPRGRPADGTAPSSSSRPVFARLRDEWAGRIDMQASLIAPLDIFLTDEDRQLADTVAATGGQFGCVTRFRGLPNAPRPPELDLTMGCVLALAAERGLDLDLHIDEATDPEARILIRMA